MLQPSLFGLFSISQAGPDHPSLPVTPSPTPRIDNGRQGKCKQSMTQTPKSLFPPSIARVRTLRGTCYPSEPSVVPEPNLRSGNGGGPQAVVPPPDRGPVSAQR